MSQYTHESNGMTFLCGYDRLDYVFMVVQDTEGEIKYSNMYEIDFTKIKDFSFFTKIAKEKFNVDIPEDIIAKIENDQSGSAEHSTFLQPGFFNELVSVISNSRHVGDDELGAVKEHFDDYDLAFDNDLYLEALMKVNEEWGSTESF